jgi:hypothetical protein
MHAAFAERYDMINGLLIVMIKYKGAYKFTELFTWQTMVALVSVFFIILSFTFVLLPLSSLGSLS